MTIEVITISGEIAMGKTTISQELVKKLPGWQHVSTGAKFREITAARGMPIQAVSSLPDEVHQAVDDWQRALAQTGSKLIIEGRLAGWLTRELAHVFRVYCYAPLDIRIARYVEREECTAEQAKNDIEYRDSRDVQKFQNAYGVEDYRAPAFYSFLLDTSTASPVELADLIIRQAGLG
ncbi:MAG TPA: cytidylate kinase family protein [Aggregatilineaceae bacterium]|nr:cytidylate kinase family protein [Aggregatilineaceae bacterium]